MKGGGEYEDYYFDTNYYYESIYFDFDINGNMYPFNYESGYSKMVETKFSNEDLSFLPNQLEEFYFEDVQEQLIKDKMITHSIRYHSIFSEAKVFSLGSYKYWEPDKSHFSMIKSF
jgi:hypothetical protein